jgi:PAS domain S-box-containing protein
MSTDASPADKLSILMIEDSALDAALIRARLEASSLSFVLTQVGDPSQLGGALEGGPYDIILSDYNLLGLPGDDILARARIVAPDVPFVFVSGALGEEKAIELLKRGATDYILKDRLDRLVPSVQRALDEARLRAETRRAYAETQQARQRLEGLLALSSGLARASSLEELLREISAHAQTFLGTRSVLLATLRGDGLSWIDDGQLTEPVSAAAILELGRRRDVVYGEGLSPQLEHVQSPGALVPLWGRERQLGLLCLVWDAPKAFVEEEMGVIEALGQHCGQTLERVLISEARALSEERFRSFVEATAQVVWFADGWGQVVSDLPGWRAFTGQEPGEILGEGWLSGVHPDDAKGVADAWVHAVQARCSYEATFRLRHHSGEWRHVLARAVPVPQSEGPVREWVGTMVDVTQTKEWERWASLALAIAENATSGLFVLNTQQQCTFMNPAGEKLTGYSFEEIQQRAVPLHDIIHHTRPDGTPFPSSECPIERALPTATHQRGEDVFVKPDGTFYPVAFTASPLDDRSGTVLEVRDTTEEKRARARLEESEHRYRLLAESEKLARQQAEQANRLKDEFLATVSHELRTPLTAMLGWVHMLRSADLGEEKRDQALETVERNARAQAKIIDDLLDVSRILAGKLRLEMESLELQAVVEQAIETAKPAALAREVRLQTALDSTIRVMGDPHRLGQVVWNLVSNAVKFTPAGGEVRVTLQGRGGHAEIEVTDTGEGISEEFLPYVFERFRQADGSTTRRQGGLGLGLSIVRHLVELHGGTVQAHSNGLGQGATFQVSLPLVAVQRQELTERRRDPGGSKVGLGGGGAQLAGVHLLVVDDEPDTRELLRTMLETCEARVTTAGSAGEALQRLQDSRPDVLISDIGMPGEDGYQLIERVRHLSAEQGGHIPAVALTAYSRAEDRTRVLLAGFNSHVPKPVEPMELLAVLVSLSRRH